MYYKIMIWANVTKFGQNFIAPQIFLGWYGYGEDLCFSLLTKSTFFKPWVATQMWLAKAMSMGRESLYLQLLLAKRTITLDNLIATNRITVLLNCFSNFQTFIVKKTPCYIILSQAISHCLFISL